MDILWYALGIAAIGIALALSIGLHELGHLFWAKRFGIKVDRYMIGFGPTIWSRTIGETEYGVKLLPLGGYIAMIGMYPPDEQGRAAKRGRLAEWARDARRASAETVAPGEESRAFYRQAVWKRLIVMFGGPFMNLLIAIVCYAVLLMGFGTVESTTTVATVSQCVHTATSSSESCSDSDPAAPAAAAGIRPGDRIVSVGGVEASSWEQMQAAIQSRAGQVTPVVVNRDGELRTLSITPIEAQRAVYDRFGRAETNADGSTKTENVGFIGVSPTAERVRQPVTAVLPAVGDNLVLVGQTILTLPQRLVQVGQAAFGTTERDPNGPMSVVGVGRVAGELVSSDQIGLTDKAATVVSLTASLNVALFAFNLIPLMPLDGGHIAGALLEALRRGWARLRRRPDPGFFDAARLMPLTIGVFAVMMGMGALLVYADIVKPIQLLGG